MSFSWLVFNESTLLFAMEVVYDMLRSKKAVTRDDPDIVVTQFVQDVVDFSSQYSRNGSFNYSAAGLRGPSQIYPKYGDYTNAFVTRYYGSIRPEIFSPIGRQDDYCSTDFVDVVFESAVYPQRLQVYETYNPGSVVRVLALCAHGGSVGFAGSAASGCNGQPGRPTPRSAKPAYNVSYTGSQWAVLWTGRSQFADLPKRSRIFTIELLPCPFPTNFIRIELCADGADYYPEIDAVCLIGRKVTVEEMLGERRTATSSAVCLSDELSSLLVQAHLTDGRPSLTTLPAEVLHKILAYLDLPSLCRLGAVCRLLRRFCCQPTWYKHVNLQPYWARINDTTLSEMCSKFVAIRKLDLSWCGPYQFITAEVFVDFIKHCVRQPDQLVSLRLSCCSFVSGWCLQTVCDVCAGLEELDLSSMRDLHAADFMPIAQLSKLVTLSLFHTQVDNVVLLAVAERCRQLRCLDVGNCDQLAFDNLLPELADRCAQLTYLNLWRASCQYWALVEFAGRLRCIEELELGWTDGFSDAFVYRLLQSCGPRLRKLGLCACRSISDELLVAIATGCPNLQTLDLLGNSAITVAACELLLRTCRQLVFLDISFCQHISVEVVANWRVTFPHVDVKRSFQESDDI